MTGRLCVPTTEKTHTKFPASKTRGVEGNGDRREVSPSLKLPAITSQPNHISPISGNVPSVPRFRPSISLCAFLLVKHSLLLVGRESLPLSLPHPHGLYDRKVVEFVAISFVVGLKLRRIRHAI